MRLAARLHGPAIDPQTLKISMRSVPNGGERPARYGRFPRYHGTAGCAEPRSRRIFIPIWATSFLKNRT